MALISCSQLSVTYGSYLAVDNVSIEINKGDYLCVVGANGSGKSTLVKALLGLVPFSQGSITTKNCGVGYLPQQSVIQRDFPASVLEVVKSGSVQGKKLGPFFTKAETQCAWEQIEKLSLTNIAKKSFMDLSGGQQQRVLLARALCTASQAENPLLVLDEPVTGLDPLITDEMYSIIRTLHAEHQVSVLMVSHDIHRAVQNATHILHMDTCCRFYGTAKEYEKTEFYKEMSSVEVCSTHCCTHCGPNCNASHVLIKGKR